MSAQYSYSINDPSALWVLKTHKRLISPAYSGFGSHVEDFISSVDSDRERSEDNA